MIAPILMPLAILGGMDGVEPMGRAWDASFECASLHRRRHYLKCAFKAIDLLVLDLMRQATKGAVA